jgi:hypothetical protein
MKLSRSSKNTVSGWRTLGVFAHFALVGEGRAQATTEPLSSEERLELEIFRKAVPELRARLDEAEASLNEKGEERARYLASAYQQRVALGDLAVRAFAWQLFAGNIILGLVVLLTVSGIGLGAYQLIVAGKIASTRLKHAVGTAEHSSALQEPHAMNPITNLEISRDKISLQTSIVGLLVLFVSGFFLLMFLREVYPIQEINQRLPAAEASGATSAKR